MTGARQNKLLQLKTSKKEMLIMSRPGNPHSTKSSVCERCQYSSLTWGRVDGLQPSGNILSVDLWKGPAVSCLDVGQNNDGGPSEHTEKYVT